MALAKLTLAVPLYNEEDTVVSVLEVLKDLELYGGLSKEVIIVNDASTDSSSEKIKNYLANNSSSNSNTQFILKEHIENQGKGAALHTAIQAATGEYLVVQDADLELDPNEINQLLEKLITEKVDVVYGSRFLGKERKGASLVHILANFFFTQMTNLLTGRTFTDIQTCYKLMPTDVLKSVKLEEKRFGFDPEITAKLSKLKHLKIAEVPISYDPRKKSSGKKIGWKDGIRAIYCILKYNFKR